MTTCEAAGLALALAAGRADARGGRIPNALTLPALAVGLLAGSPSGALLSVAPLLPLFAMLKIGGGDVKLLAALGAFLGPGRGLLVLALAVALALGTGYRRLGVWAAAAVVLLLGVGR